MPRDIMPDEEYANLLIPGLQQLVKKPLENAPSYEVRMHAARKKLGKLANKTDQEVEENALRALAKQLTRVVRQRLGNKEFEILKLEAQKLSPQSDYSPFNAMIDKLIAKGYTL